MTRVDTHVHLLPADYRSLLERRDLTPFPLPRWSAEVMEEFMARHAIDAAVLSLSPPGVYFGDQGLANELARMVNEHTAALVRAAPSRYAGLAILPLPDLDSALAELEHALDHAGLDGVLLLSNVDGIYLGDQRWDPLFDELERRGAYVLAHPTAAPGPPPLPEHPSWLYEFPFDTTRAAVNLIYSGTLERCPSIRLQLAHLGGCAPFLAHRIASLADREPERAGAARAGALAYLRRLFYDTGLSTNAVALASTLALADVAQIVFGTDWPYAALPASGDPAPGLDSLGAERARVDSVNVAALVPRFSDVEGALGPGGDDRDRGA
jgi:predicted TIM-barrel fold metal-dependent hydrolase